MKTEVETAEKPSSVFWLLVVFLAVVFLTGGTSRGDAQSLAILFPWTILACGTALITLRLEHVRQHASLFIGFGVLLAFTLLYLVPLPSNIWQSFPGRTDIVAIDEMVGLENSSRPVTLMPNAGWLSAYTLFTPLAVLLFGVQLKRDDLYRLLPLFISLGAVSGLLGLLQIAGTPGGPLYFYRITNSDSAVGLFANRNHAATLLASLFPMLAVFASAGAGRHEVPQSRLLIAAAIALVLIPLILVTGSRAGLVLAVIGLVGASLLYRQPVRKQDYGSKTRKLKWLTLPRLAVVAVLCLAILTVYFSRAEALDRLFGQSMDADSRSIFWAESLNLFYKYFPLGSGAGAFGSAYQIIEKDHMLTSFYLNRAHNDWVELAVTFGILTILFIGFAVIQFLRGTIRLWFSANKKRRSVIFGRMAGIIIAMLGAASIADYPIRTPTMMCLFGVAILWFNAATKTESSGSRIETSI